MRWTVRHDRDAFTEVWLLFENEYRKFPLYPGESAVTEYTNCVSDATWGRWFQRAVRLPTKRLSVELDFPTSVPPFGSHMPGVPRPPNPEEPPWPLRPSGPSNR